MIAEPPMTIDPIVLIRGQSVVIKLEEDHGTNHGE
jgi:hypothetical protein